MASLSNTNERATGASPLKEAFAILPQSLQRVQEALHQTTQQVVEKAERMLDAKIEERLTAMEESVEERIGELVERIEKPLGALGGILMKRREEMAERMATLERRVVELETAQSAKIERGKIQKVTLEDLDERMRQLKGTLQRTINGVLPLIGTLIQEHKECSPSVKLVPSSSSTLRSQSPPVHLEHTTDPTCSSSHPQNSLPSASVILPASSIRTTSILPPSNIPLKPRASFTSGSPPSVLSPAPNLTTSSSSTYCPSPVITFSMSSSSISGSHTSTESSPLSSESISSFSAQSRPPSQAETKSKSSRTISNHPKTHHCISSSIVLSSNAPLLPSTPSSSLSSSPTTNTSLNHSSPPTCIPLAFPSSSSSVSPSNLQTTVVSPPLCNISEPNFFLHPNAHYPEDTSSTSTVFTSPISSSTLPTTATTSMPSTSSSNPHTTFASSSLSTNPTSSSKPPLGTHSSEPCCSTPSCNQNSFPNSGISHISSLNSKHPSSNIQTTRVTSPQHSATNTNSLCPFTKAERIELEKELIKAAEDGRGDHVMRLLDTSGNPRKVFSTVAFKSALAHAVVHCNGEAVNALLTAGAGAGKNRKNTTGKRLIHCAAEAGNEPALRVLIYAGAKLNCIDMNGKTPLHMAAQSGNVAVVRTLVSAGAIVQLTDKEGRTPLHLAAFYNNEAVLQELISAGAVIHTEDHKGGTPLHCAALHNNLTAVQVLIGAGASKTLMDKKGNIPFHVTDSEVIREILAPKP